MNYTATPSTTLSGSPSFPPVRRTVDAFTRMLHALMALSFFGAYITAESELFRLVHVTLGYTLGGLLVARLVWGVIGPRHARLSALVGKLRGVGTWWTACRAIPHSGAAEWWPILRQGLNLLLPVSVAVLLLSIAPLVGSGYVQYEELTGDWMEEIHELLGNMMLMAVLVHVAAVVLLSLLRGRNLAMPMVTGSVAGKGPDLIRSNHRFLAAILLVAVLAFWVWQWQTTPLADAVSPTSHTSQSRDVGDHDN